MLNDAQVFTVDLIGGPGCGKTSLLEATLQRMHDLRIGVIVGDLATARDGQRLAKYTDQVVQINTGKGCHLEAHHVHRAIEKLHLRSLDLLFVENVGNLICPVDFDLGQDVKVGVFSVCGGDDKPAKHTRLVQESSLLLLTKTDLLPHTDFDLKRFDSDVHRRNSTVELMKISVTSGVGLDLWLRWLEGNVASRMGPEDAADSLTVLKV
jgi:hydrogenase nickel incorporation protein HypB